MKKYAVCCVILIMLIVTGCRNYRLSAESGSEWISADSMISIEISNSNYATGSLVHENTTTEIECHFGPGITEFAVFVLPKYSPNPSDGDAWLFRGDYHYDRNAETITLYISQDQIGLDIDEIVLYRNDTQATRLFSPEALF